MLGLVGAKQGDAIVYRIYVVPSLVQQSKVIYKCRLYLVPNIPIQPSKVMS